MKGSLQSSEIEKIYSTIEQVTGATQSGSYRKELLLSNVQRRMAYLNILSVDEYLRKVVASPEEKKVFVSVTTIHTTSWFREEPHFKILENYVNRNRAALKGRKLMIWSAACSTGEEVYSIALELERLAKNDHFHYEIHGSDIDEKSVQKAQKCLYPIEAMSHIPIKYHTYLLKGSSSASHLFTLEKEIRIKCKFNAENLTQLAQLNFKYDIIFCRNVLIYFDQIKTQAIIDRMQDRLCTKGILVLGHSEPLSHFADSLKEISPSCYEKLPNSELEILNKQKRVLVIDDSSVIRKVLRHLLESKKFQVSECESAEKATVLCSQDTFDLITLDLNLTGEDGLQWLSRMRQGNLKTPVVIVSESSESEAEKLFGAVVGGAQHYFTKTQLNQNPEVCLQVCDAIATSQTSSRVKRTPIPQFDEKSFIPELILIGLSTGGPEVLSSLIENFPQPCPPMIIVQHISQDFLAPFARRFSKASGLQLGIPSNEIPIRRNHVYFSDSDNHIVLKEEKSQIYLIKENSDKKNGHRPSVSKLFESAAKIRKPAIGIIMTGMGTDGSDETLQLSQTGKVYVMAQDQASSVVFGMAKRAIELGGVHFIGNPHSIREKLIQLLKTNR